MRIKLTSNLGCKLRHRWELIAEIGTGFTQYYTCKDCGGRKVEQKGNGYQPIDWDWLKGLYILPKGEKRDV